ncbi:uncharacterized protein [Aristolochia californica]|uniref:uncharacterized protein n=1 Tax=Aristolochia californica TaxID=171875 RepID=UPI0035E027DB
MAMGKRKLEMKKIENRLALQVTFSKRKKGLFKKVEQLSVLIGASVLVVVFVPVDRPFVFEDEGLMQRYLEGETNISKWWKTKSICRWTTSTWSIAALAAVIDGAKATQLHDDDDLMETEEEGNSSFEISPASEDFFNDLPPLDVSDNFYLDSFLR